MLSFLKKLAYFVLLVVICVCAVNFWLNNKKYVISEDDVIKIAKKYINPTTSMDQVVESIHKDFKAIYQNHIVSREDLKFLLLSAGGLTLCSHILHASFTEFIMICGTEVGGVGHSGRYWFNKTDVVLSGEIQAWKEGTYNAESHGPGDVIKHDWGVARVLNYKAKTWKVCYGRGFIMCSFPFLVSDTLFGNQDYVNLYHFFRIYAKYTFHELIQSVMELQHMF